MGPDVVGVYYLGRDFSLAIGLFLPNNYWSDFGWLIVLSLTAL